MKRRRGTEPARGLVGRGMKMFIVLFRYKKPGDKALGPVVQYRIYARDLTDAWAQAERYSTYQGVEIVDVVPV
jgi:hypothetical protein